MSSHGRGKSLTRPAWMHTPRQNPTPPHPPPALPRSSTNPLGANPAPAPTTTAQAPDWLRAVSANGRPYWYNRTTGQTTWTDPALNPSSVPNPSGVPSTAAAAAPAANLPAQASAAKSTGAGDPVWREVRTPEGRAYFYNTLTKRTQWHRPPDFRPSAAHPDDGLASGNVPSLTNALTAPSSRAAVAVPPFLRRGVILWRHN